MKRIFGLITLSRANSNFAISSCVFVIPSFAISSLAIASLTGVVAANEITSNAPIPTQGEKLPSFAYKNFDFWVKQCQTLEKLQKHTETIAACEKAIALKPKKKNTALWKARGHALFNLGKYSDALISYEQVLQREPNNSSLLTQRCNILVALGNNEDAILSCEEALKVNSNWGNITPAIAWYHRGSALKKLNRPPEAITSFERATLIQPNYSLAFTRMCEASIDLGLYQDAIKACDTAIEKNGDWGKVTAAIAWKNKAVALTKLGKLTESIYAYQRALEINPQDAIAWYEQGKLLQKSQQYERASSAYNMAIGIQPKYSQALARQTETLNKLQNYELALQMSDLALAGDGVWSEETTLAYLWNQRSSALVHLKKYEESIADAERAIALKRDYAEAWNNKAVSLWNLNKYLQAEQASLKAINFAQKNTQAWFNRGRILSSLRRYPEAIKAYEKALEGDLKKEDNFIHGNIWTNKGVAYWYEAKKLQQPQQKSQKYSHAYLNLKKATEINSKSFEAWYNKAAVILEWQCHNKSQKKCNEALTAYNKANEINPDNSAVLTGKAMILASLGKHQDALTNFDDALNIDPDNILAQNQRDKLLGFIQSQQSKQ